MRDELEILFAKVCGVEKSLQQRKKKTDKQWSGDMPLLMWKGNW